MIIEGKVGKQKLSDGAHSPIRLDESGSTATVNSHSFHEHMVLDGRTYVGSNLGGTPVTTQAGLSATTPALTLYNPVGSGVYLVLVGVNINITASPAAAAGLMLAYNSPTEVAPTATTQANVTSAIIGKSGAPAGQCYRICTLPSAPLFFRAIGGTTGASAIGGVVLKDHIDGEIIISPGVAISIQATSAATIIASVTWEEKDI